MTATLFVATVLTAIAPMEVKAEVHEEGCTGPGITWYGNDDEHVASCNGCNAIVGNHMPVAGDSIVKIDSRYHGKKCTVEGCSLSKFDELLCSFLNENVSALCKCRHHNVFLRILFIWL